MLISVSLWISVTKIEGSAYKSRRLIIKGRLLYVLLIGYCIIRKSRGSFSPPGVPQQRHKTSVGKTLPSIGGVSETLICEPFVAQAGSPTQTQRLFFPLYLFLKARPLYFYTTNFSLVLLRTQPKFKSNHIPPKTPEFGRKSFVLI